MRRSPEAPVLPKRIAFCWQVQAQGGAIDVWIRNYADNQAFYAERG
jgi:hypothetical protein